jgi:hypothetical protein
MSRTQSAEASNYPFCTIDPNSSKVGIYDKTIMRLYKAAKPHKLVPAQLEVWDIAGLVKGASKGEGLGNQFLGNIRSVDLIIHVIRCFKDKDIQYVNDVKNIDPVDEMETVKTELILADLEVLRKFAKKNSHMNHQVNAVKILTEELNKGKAARDVEMIEGDFLIAKTIPLLTNKPVVY